MISQHPGTGKVALNAQIEPPAVPEVRVAKVPGLAGSDWEPEDSPSVHYALRLLKIGDLVCLKSSPPGRGLTIKAIGVVSDASIRRNPGRRGVYRNVRWLWDGRQRPLNIGQATTTMIVSRQSTRKGTHGSALESFGACLGLDMVIGGYFVVYTA